MADLRPFPGLRYDPGRTGPLERVLAPPYDVLSEAEVAGYGKRSPYNIVHLTRPGSDYNAAGRRLEQWIEERVLLEDAPAMYLHEVTFEGRTRRDLVAALRLQPYSDGVVLPHERTHAGPKQDRFQLYRATAASLEPLWFLYEAGGSGVAQALAEGFARPPQREFGFADEQHRLWVLEEVGWQLEVRQALRDVQLLLADGHHRYETALAYAKEVGGDADAASRYTLALLTDLADPGLEVLPTHRLLRAGVAVTGGRPASDLREMLKALDDQVAAGVYRYGRFQVLPLEGEVAVVELHRQVVDNILGRRSLEDSVEYTRDAEEAVRWVDEGRGTAAFFLGRPDLGAVLGLARQGMTMPAKSTYFHPKPPSGMVMLRLEPGRNL